MKENRVKIKRVRKGKRTCKTCRHWEEGCCLLVGEEVCGEKRQDATDKAPVVVVRVADDWNLSIKLRTSPDFGCVLHKEGGVG